MSQVKLCIIIIKEPIRIGGFRKSSLSKIFFFRKNLGFIKIIRLHLDLYHAVSKKFSTE